MKPAIVLWSAAVVCGTAVLRDTLYFKRGRGFSCLVVGLSNQTFRVVVDGARQEVPAANVDRIEFTVGAPTAAPPCSPYPSAYEFQEEAGYAPKSYLEGRTVGEPTASCTPKQLREKVFTLENNVIKVVFKRRSRIEQIGTNECTSSLFLMMITSTSPRTSMRPR